MSDEPHAYTESEARTIFVQYVWNCIAYWTNDARTPTLSGKMEGLAFSILVMLDGESCLPGFKVIPNLVEGDVDYYKQNGDNWFPETDIGGCLHEVFCECDPKKAEEAADSKEEY